jgi:hypothetical protein
LVILWFAGELLGFIVGGLMTGGQGGVVVYMFALVGAAAGTVTAFRIANNAPSDTSALQTATPMIAPDSSVEDRLNRLHDLQAKNVNTEQEFDQGWGGVNR